MQYSIIYTVHVYYCSYMSSYVYPSHQHTVYRAPIILILLEHTLQYSAYSTVYCIRQSHLTVLTVLWMDRCIYMDLQYYCTSTIISCAYTVSYYDRRMIDHTHYSINSINLRNLTWQLIRAVTAQKATIMYTRFIFQLKFNKCIVFLQAVFRRQPPSLLIFCACTLGPKGSCWLTCWPTHINLTQQRLKGPFMSHVQYCTVL